MKLQRKNTKGFTLIELLVVITIIGILSTGAVGVYTSQIEKARDTTRITDIGVLDGGIQMLYQDYSEYPALTSGQEQAFYDTILTVVQQLPKDPKYGQTCNNSQDTGFKVGCAYAYNVGTNANGIVNNAYELSTAFENTSNLKTKAAKDKDNGDDESRWEVGTLKQGDPSSDIITKIDVDKLTKDTDKGIVEIDSGLLVFAGIKTN